MSEHHLLFGHLGDSLLHCVSGDESVDHDTIRLAYTMGTAERLYIYRERETETMLGSTKLVYMIHLKDRQEYRRGSLNIART